MKLPNAFALCLLAIILYACQPRQDQPDSVEETNPPAEGFDFANSDPAAIELADSIMQAMGGRKKWDDTRFISWNFFGRRDLVWDKHTDRVRIETPRDSTIYLVNVRTGEGKVQIKGKEVTNADTLKKLLDNARAIWINDSYWLVMPFKLKDSGVTLKYLGEDTLSSGDKCNLLELTFKNVGVTPQNKYLLYVDLKDNLVKQWAYFKEAGQDSANFTRPWDNYRKYGEILLSADRSDSAGPKGVKVDDALPDEVFTRF